MKKFFQLQDNIKFVKVTNPTFKRVLFSPYSIAMIDKEKMNLNLMLKEVTLQVIDLSLMTNIQLLPQVLKR